MLKINSYIIFALFIITCSCKNKQESFQFVQLCDTQIGIGGYEHDLATFEQAVEQINKINPDFTVICGDLVHNNNGSSFVDFKNVKKKLNNPCYVAPGNHDIGKIPNKKTLEKYRKAIGKDYYEFKHKGFSFIVTNSQLWRIYIEKESEKHDKWFRETLKANAIKQHPIVVVCHYPLYVNDSNEKNTDKNFPINERKIILNLFDRYDVKAYLSGHEHKYIQNTYYNTVLVSGQATSKNFDKSPLGFRLWEITSDGIKNNFVPLNTLSLNKEAF